MVRLRDLGCASIVGVYELRETGARYVMLVYLVMEASATMIRGYTDFSVVCMN